MLQDIHKCLSLSALHFQCCKIFKGASPCQHFTLCAARYSQVPVIVSTSLSVLQDIQRCLYLSALHFTCCNIFTSVSTCQHFTLCAARYSHVHRLVSSTLCTLQVPYCCLAVSDSMWTKKDCYTRFPCYSFRTYFQDASIKFNLERKREFIPHSAVGIDTRLRAGPSGVRVLAKAKVFFFSKNVHTGSGASPVSYSMCNGVDAADA